MAQINKPGLHFNTITYTGNGGTQALTGVGFQPDLLWIKQRNESRSHQIMDAVRGANVRIKADSTEAETSSALTSFDSDGFTVNGTSLDGTNKSSGSYVAWNWKAGGAGSSNSDGSITSTVSVNTTAGCSIVKYAGAAGTSGTVGHGLGAVPNGIWLKDLATNNWNVYHSSLANSQYLQLNEAAAVGSATSRWNNTTPTSTVFTVGNDDSVNNSGRNFIAYVFAEKKGYSRIGSYIGTSNADGPFIYCGFRPNFLLIKNASSGNQLWELFDNKRIGYNPNNRRIYTNTNDAEDTSLRLDLLSNGFKLRTNGSHVNNNGQTMVFWAFAEHPLVGTNNVAGVAR
tara:strand:+ start:917 stop:1942 length:1026 start_codon:yes stop_codon:yes gene_type:complete